MTTASDRINYLCMMLHETGLREFDKLVLAGNSTANHLKHITEILLEYFSPINSLFNRNHAMRRAMHKTHGMLFKCFAEQLTEINNFFLSSLDHTPLMS